MDESRLPAIYTVGYGSRSVDQLIALLKRNGIDCLVDVRTSPYSRYKPEFSKDALEAVITECGLRYLFLGQLLGGRPDDAACYADGKVDYDRVRTKEFYLRGIDQVLKERERGTRIALMCSEGKPDECHRSKLIGATLVERRIPVVHLDEEGVPLTQEEVIS